MASRVAAGARIVRPANLPPTDLLQGPQCNLLCGQGRLHAVSAFTVTLVTPTSTRPIQCDTDSHILDAAEEGGSLDLPYSCRSGAALPA
jgi:ferredoxin